MIIIPREIFCIFTIAASGRDVKYPDKIILYYGLYSRRVIIILR